jgi:UDP-glucose 4-epimerase
MAARNPVKQQKTSKHGRLALIVGGAGFIGSHTVDALLASGCRVRVLDDLSTGSRGNLPLQHPKLELIDGSMLDPSTVDAAMRDVQWCVHLAAQVSVARSMEAPQESARRNILGFINVLKAAHEASIQRLVYASSAAVYGDLKSLPLSEQLTPRPTSPYGLEKFVDELYADLYQRLHDMRTLGLRYFNVYGPRQSPDSPYSGVITKFIDCLRTGRQPVIYGDGKQSRDFIHVSDIARANIAALRSASRGICNVATGQRISLLDLIRILGEVAGLSIVPRFEANRPGDIRHSCGTNTRLHKRLNFRARCTLHEGLSDLIHSQTLDGKSSGADRRQNSRPSLQHRGIEKIGVLRPLV